MKINLVTKPASNPHDRFYKLTVIGHTRGEVEFILDFGRTLKRMQELGFWNESEIAKQNYWDNDRHTLYILEDLKKGSSFPGVQFALERVINMIKIRGKSK